MCCNFSSEELVIKWKYWPKILGWEILSVQNWKINYISVVVWDVHSNSIVHVQGKSKTYKICNQTQSLVGAQIKCSGLEFYSVLFIVGFGQSLEFLTNQFTRVFLSIHFTWKMQWENWSEKGNVPPNWVVLSELALPAWATIHPLVRWLGFYFPFFPLLGLPDGKNNC